LEISSERREDGARALLECIKSIGAFGTGQGIIALVEHDDFSAADQKAPSAADAVIKAGFLREERTVTGRPDYECVPQAPVTPLEVDAISQKVHEKV
jgi:hypothetical protein